MCEREPAAIMLLIDIHESDTRINKYVEVHGAKTEWSMGKWLQSLQNERK